MGAFCKKTTLFIIWEFIPFIMVNSQISPQINEDFLAFYNTVYKNDSTWERVMFPLTYYANDTLSDNLTDTLVSEYLIKVSKFVDTAYHKVSIRINCGNATVQSFDKITGIVQKENFIQLNGKWFMDRFEIHTPPDDIMLDSIDQFFKKVTDKYKVDDFDGAFRDLNYLIKYTPPVQNYYRVRAMIFQNWEEYENAVDDYAMSLSLYDVPEAYFQRAYCYVKLRDYKSAFDDLNYLLIHNPEHTDGYLARAHVYGSLTDTVLCIKDLTRAMELAVSDSFKFRSTAITAYRFNQYNMAIKAAKAFLNVNSSDEFTNRVIFLSFWSLDMPDSARYYYNIFTKANFDLSRPDTALVFRVSKYFNEFDFLNPDTIKDYRTTIYFKRTRSGLEMVNTFEAKGSKSYGKIARLKLTRNVQHSGVEYAMKEYRFIWHYRNSYDNEKGKCIGKLQIVFSSDKPTFRLTLFVLNDRIPLIMEGNMLEKCDK